MKLRSIVLSVLAIGLLATSPVRASAQTTPAPCEADSAFAVLDFWVGDWDVFVGTRKVGENHIAKELSGCAVTEDWTDADGSHGRSLFYYIPAEKTWKQVWITDNALMPGGVKEKTLIERFPDGGVRFQGRLRRLDGKGWYLDRTTLSPIENGDVRQVIEISVDDGKTWRTGFDARYTRQ